MNSTDKNNSITSLQNFQKNCPEKPHGQSGAIKKECKPGVEFGNAMPPPTDRSPGSALFLDGAVAQQPSRQSTGLLVSPKGDFMRYSTTPQPVDEDLVQRLREKGAL